MRKEFKANNWLYPMPVLIVGTYDENGTPNAMNAAWGGVYDTGMVMLCLSHDHKTTANIKTVGAFTVSFGTEDTVTACDYVGIVSGNQQPDKLAKAGFTAVKSSHVNAPVFKELPMALECTLEKFNEDGICIGRIVSISADASILNAEGKIDRTLLRPICFDSVENSYYTVGQTIAKAFSEGKKLQ